MKERKDEAKSPSPRASLPHSVTETVVVKVKEMVIAVSLSMCSVRAGEPCWHSKQEIAGSLAGVQTESSWDAGVQGSHPMSGEHLEGGRRH